MIKGMFSGGGGEGEKAAGGEDNSDGGDVETFINKETETKKNSDGRKNGVDEGASTDA